MVTANSRNIFSPFPTCNVEFITLTLTPYEHNIVWEDRGGYMVWNKTNNEIEQKVDTFASFLTGFVHDCRLKY